MKRREWLKSLLCAPLALLASKKSERAVVTQVATWGCETTPGVAVKVEGSLIHERQLEDVIVKAMRSAQQRGRLG